MLSVVFFDKGPSVRVHTLRPPVRLLTELLEIDYAAMINVHGHRMRAGAVCANIKITPVFNASQLHQYGPNSSCDRRL
jgi:hypothetical protein